MENRLVKRAARPPLIRYGVAVACALMGIAMRLSMAEVLTDKVPYITFFLATALSATFGGFGPGMLTTVLGAIFAAFYVVRTYETAPFTNTGDYLGLALFLGIGSLISYLAGRLIDATQHQNALRQLFEQTLVSIGDAVISTDEEKRVRMLNPVAERLTGWKDAEAKGKPIEEVFSVVKEGSDIAAEIPIDKVLKTGTVSSIANHTDLLTKDGRRVPIDDSAAPIKDAYGVIAGSVLVFRDITQRRTSERGLEKAEYRSREILESITDGFIVFDLGWHIKYINPAGEKLIGRSASSLIGKNYWEEFPETLGTEIERSYKRALSDKVQVHFEVHYDEWDKWFELHVYPAADEVAVYFRDITEPKNSEVDLRRLNEDLKQFTFAATHDLREPLRMMIVYVQMLQKRMEEQLDEESKGYISNVVIGAERMSRLIDGLLQFSRMGEVDETEPVSVSSDHALSEALDNLTILIAETKAALVHDELPPVMADPAHLCQLFQNLIENALKYRRPDIHPVVRISARADEGSWTFAVQDNGVGIDPRYFSQIFTPFKRLHGPAISGAGIGLATCKRIVERYHGRIWVESQTGDGSTFYFSLPKARGE